MPRRQLDLLRWQPGKPVASFEAVQVRGATIAARLARAISQALSDCKLTRAGVAEAMTAYLGKPVSKPMLDAYASPARESHVISVDRFAALVHATGDRRLLEMIAEPMGWAVIERRYLPLIDLATVREHEDEVRRQADALRRQARSEGLL